MRGKSWWVAAMLVTGGFGRGWAYTALEVEKSSVSLESLPLVSISTQTWRTASNHAFKVGENLSFVVRWGVVTAGYASLSIQGIEPMNERPTYHIVEDASSAGLVDTFYSVKDRNEAWLDVESLTSLKYVKQVREGHYKIDETVTMDQLLHRFFYHGFRLDKNTYEDKEGTVPLNVLDVLGSLYYIRTRQLEVGQSYKMDVLSGEKVFPLIVKVKKRERVKVAVGTFECIRVEPLLREPGIFISKGKKLEVWLTADDRHMPVLMRSEVFIGHVAAELVSYKSPTDEPQIPVR